MHLLLTQLHYLRNLLRRRGQTREDAEDLVQEAMLRLYVYTQAGGQVRNTEAFLRRTVLNLAVDVHRHSHSDRYSREPVEDLDLIDMAPPPDEVLAAEQRLFSMKTALDKVNPRTRQVFFMHRLQGLSHAEIAEKLRISKSSVEKHIASALVLLCLERQRE
jgi:RNA polymerase sigma-70 factor (ECF subfamily)